MFGISWLTTKFIVIGAIVLVVLGYIGFLKLEVGHYKNKAEQYEAAYSLVIHTQATRLAQVEASLKAQDEARQRQTIKAQEVIDKLVLSNQETIKKYEKELASITIPSSARSVFNNTNNNVGPDQKDSVGKADTKDASAVATLADLLKANEINKQHYLECADDKNAWIQLWKETVENLNGPSTP